jgi:hypothetical protein
LKLDVLAKSVWQCRHVLDGPLAELSGDVEGGSGLGVLTSLGACEGDCDVLNVGQACGRNCEVTTAVQGGDTNWGIVSSSWVCCPAALYSGASMSRRPRSKGISSSFGVVFLRYPSKVAATRQLRATVADHLLFWSPYSRCHRDMALLMDIVVFHSEAALVH